jgi:hypothetical protein
VNDNGYPSSTGTRQSLAYTTISLGARYSILDETVSILSTLSPTLGGFRRTVIDLGTEWYVLSTMSLFVQFSYFNNEGSSGDNMWSLRYRYHL